MLFHEYRSKTHAIFILTLLSCCCSIWILLFADAPCRFLMYFCLNICTQCLVLAFQNIAIFAYALRFFGLAQRFCIEHCLEKECCNLKSKRAQCARMNYKFQVCVCVCVHCLRFAHSFSHSNLLQPQQQSGCCMSNDGFYFRKQLMCVRLSYLIDAIVDFFEWCAYVLSALFAIFFCSH